MEEQARNPFRDDCQLRGEADMNALLAAVLSYPKNKAPDTLNEDEASRAAVFRMVFDYVKTCNLKCMYDKEDLEKLIASTPGAEGIYFHKMGRMIQYAKMRFALMEIGPEFLDPKHMRSLGRVQHMLDVVESHGINISMNPKGEFIILNVKALIHLCDNSLPEQAPAPYLRPAGMAFN